MPYGIGLKDEHPTSNIQRPTSNEITNIQYRILLWYLVAVNPFWTFFKIMRLSRHHFPHSTFDVRYSFFNSPDVMGFALSRRRSKISLS
jgi:hypothetical protein